MSGSDSLAALGPVADALDALRVRWHIGGSLASSGFGVGRSTIDVDIVADLQPEHAEPLCRRLAGAYYAELELVRTATATRSSCNLIHLATMHKVDVFVVKDEPYDRQAIGRSVSQPFPGSDRTFPFATAEDVILSKLRWFREAGGSERQWTDVLGVLRVQHGRLDDGYLDRWAGDLDVADLLAKARAEAAEHQ